MSIGRKRVSFVLAFIRQFALMIPAVLIMTHFFGLYGVYFTQPVCDVIYNTVIIILLVLEFKRMPREKAMGSATI